MPFLCLRDLRSGERHEFHTAEVRIGRDPSVEFAIAGAGRELVSAQHARIAHRDGAWYLDDLQSRNGTYLDGRRLTPGAPILLAAGQVIGLGTGSVRLKVEAVRRQKISETVAELPEELLATVRAGMLADDEDDAPTDLLLQSPKTSDAPSFSLTLIESREGTRYEVTGNEIRIGRGRECEVRPVAPTQTTVSRVHAKIFLRPDGVVAVQDAGSRHGTLVNGVSLHGEHHVQVGDRLKLGTGGPELRVAALDNPFEATAEKMVPPVPARRSFGGRGRTAFFSEKLAESSKRSARRARLIVWSFVGLLAVSVGGVYWLGERRVAETAARLAAQQEQVRQAQQAATDSVWRAAQMEYARLEQQLTQARASAAPVTVVESLRVALEEAGQRTADLEAALQRAQVELAQQISAGDSLQRRAHTELSRLRTELRRARESQVSNAMVDSLRSAVRAAEDRASALSSQVRAIRGVNLAAVAQGNQAAVGLVTAYFGTEVFDGSGFALTASGYFVTNRHVVTEQAKRADSLFVTMADQRFMVRTDLVAVAPPDGPDLALLKIRSYTGPVIARIDWAGTQARQGEPAALIGFPAGLTAALDRTSTVRTSMSAGVFSKVTPELIQFDGFTVSGSSGSPIFNADGDVVAIHRAGLREAAGLGFAVPIPLLIPLLPPEARAELGL